IKGDEFDQIPTGMQRHAKHEGRSALKPSIANRCTVQQQHDRAIRSREARPCSDIEPQIDGALLARPETKAEALLASLPHPQKAATAATLDRPWSLEKHGIDP